MAPVRAFEPAVADADRPRGASAAGILAILLTLAGPANAQTEVSGNTVTSTQFPPVVMEFDADLEYVGSSEFVLYDVADAVIHVFVERDDRRRVQRLYWIQFEGYLPRVDHTYDYTDSQGRTEIGGHTYYEDAWVWNLDAADVRSGSDTDHVLKLLRRRDLELGPRLLGLRLVRLDAERRNELMIVYLEDLRAAGIPPDALSGGTRDRVVAALRARALEGFAIEEREAGN